MATASEAFNKLEKDAKGNELGSLETEEKNALKSVKLEDIVGFKSELENKKFELQGGAKLTLKQIVQFFNPQTNSVEFYLTVKGEKQLHKVPVQERSDLAAAIQFYLIANGQDIRTNRQKSSNPGGKATDGIDGQIGTSSKTAIGNVKAIRRGEQNSKDNLDEVREQNVDRLLNAIYTDYVGDYKDLKYDLLNTKSGVNKGTIKKKTINGDKVTITYKSAIGDKPYKTIEVDASQCKTGKLYSVDKFGKAIEKAIKAKEADLQKAEEDRLAKEALDAESRVIVDGINKFDEKSVSNKVLRKYLSDKGLNFKVNSINNNGVNFSYAGGTILGMSRKDLLTNGKFNSTALVNKIEGYYLPTATTYVKGEINKAKNAMSQPGDLKDVSSVQYRIDQCTTMINEIASYGKDFQAEMNEIVKKKTEYVNQKSYLTVKSSMETGVSTVQNTMKGVTLDKFDEKFDVALNEIRKYVTVVKVDDSHYNILYTSPTAQSFKAVGKLDEYKTMVQNLVKPIPSRMVKFNSVE